MKNETEKKKNKEVLYKCDFCGKGFKKESTLIVHMCKYKSRWMIDQNEKHVKFGFYVYKRFYDLNFRLKKEKTFFDFIKSQYYNSFVRFGKYVQDRYIVYPEKFVDFLIKNAIPLKRWCDDDIYQEFLKYLLKNEPVEQAVERNLLVMEQWAKETGHDWKEFFRKVETPKATHMIMNGKISPWILYCCSEGSILLERLSEEQINMVMDYIDPSFWDKKIKENYDDVKLIETTLKETGL